MRGGRTSDRRQSVFGIASQLINAGTNVASVYLASRLLVPDTFGSFVLAFAVVVLVLATGRGLIGATMLAQVPTLPDAARRGEAVRSALGFTVLVGLLGAGLLPAVAAWTPGAVWFVPWVTVALLHDVARHALIAVDDRAAALVLDVVWALAQGACLTALWVAGAPLTVATLAAAWGVGATAGLAAFAVRARSGAVPSDPRPWVRSTRDIAGWFTAICALGQLELYLVLLLTAALLSPADAGGLRAVQLLVLQPPLVLFGALIAVVTPGIARAGGAGVPLRREWRRAVATVVPLGAVVLLVGVSGDRFMAVLFGGYTAYSPLVLPVAVQAVAILLSVPTSALLMGTRRARLELALHVLRTVLALAATAGGALLAGPAGLAWSLALASTVMLVVMTAVARRELRRGDLGTADGPPAVPVGPAVS